MDAPTTVSQKQLDDVHLGDFGGIQKSAAYHCAVWDVTIINLGNFDTTDFSLTQHVPIGIV